MSLAESDKGPKPAREIEAKILCRDPDALRARLVELGAEIEASGLEHNVVFDTPEGLLQKRDALLRLRSYAGVVLTYKGPRDDRSCGVKDRAETEVEVSDFDAAESIITSLGFTSTWVYQKRREKWKLGPVEVCLDTLPAIGHYAEIEAPTRREVLDTLGVLGLSEGDITPLTYLEVFKEHLEKRGLEFQDMVFKREDEK